MEPCDSEWRGLGVIKGSGMRLQEEWSAFDARKKYKIPPIQEKQILHAGAEMFFRENVNLLIVRYLVRSVHHSIRLAHAWCQEKVHVLRTICTAKQRK